MRYPACDRVKVVAVDQGLAEAAGWIVEEVETGDIFITGDIPWRHAAWTAA